MFAENYPRDEDGLILFPRDDEYRRELFPFLNLSEHPAKANIWLVQEVVQYLTNPDETIMDIMSGTGTILIATLLHRRVVCIEIEEAYQDIIEQAIKAIDTHAPGAGDMATLIPGDCMRILPIQVADHVIFSPPYASIMKKKTMDKFSADTVGDGILKYSKNPHNIGNLNEFLYHQRMEIVYKKVFDSLPLGGTLTIIIKDHIRDGKRVALSDRAEKDCRNIGFTLFERHKWLAPGSPYLAIKRARGDPTVDDEDIIMLRK